MTTALTDKASILALLNCSPEEETEWFRSAVELRNQTIGNQVYLRGLIEISSTCRKNCFYCGIRKHNLLARRYSMNQETICNSALLAHRKQFGSIVLQGGERSDPKYALFIESVIKEIRQQTNDKLGITLSLGDQKEDTYKRWFDAGAHRYLLRIETSNEALYRRIHPISPRYAYKKRLESLSLIRKHGYQVGSGVMIGLPWQTIDMLADDLLFLKSIDVDMVGMGPYIEHQNTPLYLHRSRLLPIEQRLNLSLRMIAALRLLMPDVNIAATTALKAIDPQGCERGLAAGANVMMPNVSPPDNRRKYNLYQNKPIQSESDAKSIARLTKSVRRFGSEIAFKEWGDSSHFKQRNSQS